MLTSLKETAIQHTLYMLPSILESPNFGRPVKTNCLHSDDLLVLEFFGQPLHLVRHWQATLQMLAASTAALAASPATLSTSLDPQFREHYGSGVAFTKLATSSYKRR